MEEESFPRGGTIKRSKGQTKHLKNEDKDPDLFKTSEEDKERKSKGNRKRKSEVEEKSTKKAKKQKMSGMVQMMSPVGHIDILSYKLMTPGMLVLGCVKEIREFDLLMSLPNGLVGTVPITGVSNGYKDLLMKIAEGEGTQEDLDVHTLFELFKLGMVLPCKIMDVKQNKKGKKDLVLSINPREINQHINTSDIRNGLVLAGSIISQEDHGYIVDVGVKGTKAFLVNESAERFIQLYNDGYPLMVGQPVLCKIQTGSDRLERLVGETRVVNITVDPNKVGNAEVKKSMELKFSCLVPGMKVTCVVEKTSEEGINVKFLSYTGSIHKSHLTVHPEKYEKQQKLVASILYIHPLTKSVYLSALPHMVNNIGVPVSHQFEGLSLGTILDSAEVFRVDKRAVYFKLTEKIKGLATIKNLSDKEVTDVKSQFKRGSKHRCRVLDFDYNDHVALVTLRESILNQQFLKLEDISMGAVIECEVAAIHDKGVTVKVTNQIKGFIPSMHLADIPLKHPEKKFEVGKKLKCRVISVDIEKKKLKLTNKKSLIQSKFPILTRYSQLQRGVVVEGYVVSISDKGVLVAFYDDMKGWVPTFELSTEPIPYPEKVFYKGQVVKCQVLNWSEEDNRLTLSFKIENKIPFGVGVIPEDYQVGKLVDCKIKNKTDKGIDVELIPSKAMAYLPKMHLSDSAEICDILLDFYKEGTIIRDVMYVNKTKIPIITHRKSMIEASKDKELVTSFDQLQPGIMIPGSVKNVMDYGIFVQFPGGLIGLAPNKYAADIRVPDMKSVYKPGQSVIAKVIEVDKEKKRFLISLRMADCYHGDTDIGLDLLENNLKEMDSICETMSKKKGIKAKLSKIEVGSIHLSEVTDIHEHGALCKLDNGIKGLVAMEHIEGVEISIGDKVNSVVLYVDIKNNCVELTFNKELIKAITNRKENKISKVKADQVIKSEILLVKEHFVLVALKGHGAGKLAYLPSKRHLNDVLEMHQYFVKQVNPVVIKQECGSHQLASLQIHEDRKQKELELEMASETKVGTRKHDLEVGMLVKALIRQVLPYQMNILVNYIPGRIHLTEVLDELEDGTDPFLPYKESMTVNVRIIGFRDAKSHKYLPVSHPNLSTALPECSIKPSKMTAARTGEERIFNPGDKVIGFVHNYSKHCLWMDVTPSVRGRVYCLNLSDDLKVLGNPPKYFKPGEGYNAKVIGVGENGLLELTLIDVKETVQKDRITKGMILNVSKFRGLTVQLVEGYKGVIGLTDISDSYMDNPTKKFRMGQCVKCFVMSVNPKNKDNCVLSLRKSRLKTGNTKVDDPDIRDASHLKKGQVLRGYITQCNKSGLSVSLRHNISGYVNIDDVSDYFIQNLDQLFSVLSEKVVTVKVLSKTKKICLSMRESETKISEIIPHEFRSQRRCDLGKSPNLTLKKKRKRSISDSSTESILDSVKKRKKKSSEKEAEKKVTKTTASSDTDSGVEVKEDSELENQVASNKKASEDIPRLQLSAGFSWDTDFAMPVDSQSHHDNSSSDESGDEEKIDPKTKGRKDKKAEEKKLFELEKSRLEGDMIPESSEDFDRLVVHSPDSSIVWLRYMAYHLETAEIEKARAVAERALKTISYREEQEKLNVWVAYLNLENMYGSPESLKAVLDRAIQQNESLKVYNQMINIYVKSGKIQEAEQLYNTIIKKFSIHKDVWTGFGLFYFKNDRIESARKLLQRSFKSLQKRDHVDVIAKFAQMEYKYGEPERGKTMFENILSNYPKRSDLWSIYIDMVTKLGDTDAARQLYERVIHLKMSAKKMKFFFKKYLDFEKNHGDNELVESVKLKALDYVESRGYIDD